MNSTYGFIVASWYGTIVRAQCKHESTQFHVSTGISHCRFPRCKVAAMRELKDSNFSKTVTWDANAWHLSFPQAIRLAGLIASRWSFRS